MKCLIPRTEMSMSEMTQHILLLLLPLFEKKISTVSFRVVNMINSPDRRESTTF